MGYQEPISPIRLAEGETINVYPGKIKKVNLNISMTKYVFIKQAKYGRQTPVSSYRQFTYEVLGCFAMPFCS
jgi:hypothetical protein